MDMRVRTRIRPRDKVREDKVLDKVVWGRVEGSGHLGEAALPCRVES